MVVHESIDLTEVFYNLPEYNQKLLSKREETDCFITGYINNFKGEEKMRSEKIIKIWRDNQRSAIFEIINKKETEILNSDPLYSSIKKHVDEIDKILSEQNFNKVPDEIQFKAYKLKTTDALLLQNKTFGSKLQEDLAKQYDEICAMLSACDTYGQEMEVLKVYKIVGKDGKLMVVCGDDIQVIQKEINTQNCEGCKYFDNDDTYILCQRCKRLVRVNDEYIPLKLSGSDKQ